MRSFFWKLSNYPCIPQLVCAATLSVGLGLSTIAPASAEGSRSLFPANATGSRANLEWRASTTAYFGSLTRRTLLRVYANRGEAILLGSSAMGINNGDILLFSPNQVPLAPVGKEPLPPNPTFTCSTQRATTGNASLGLIGTRAQEQAGPTSIADPATGTAGGGVPGGYTPCYYVAAETGVYTVAITGPGGLNSTANVLPSGSLTDLTTPANAASVAAWDVTVRDNLTSLSDRSGRLFTYYLTLFTGANQRPINGAIYAVTTDGFTYLTRFNGIDPNGFVVYGNRQGFLNTDGSPLNRDLIDVAQNDLLTSPQGGVQFTAPEFPLFFSLPDPSARSFLGIPDPIVPTITSNTFQFRGTAGNNNSLTNTGGTFSYQSNVPHVYEIVISRDGSNFDPTVAQNRVLRGVRDTSGATTVTWDGRDNVGQPFPVGTNYQARLTVRSGEYHFPLLDVENSSGGPSFQLINPPGGVCPPTFVAPCFTAFYDDRAYRTADSTPVPGNSTLNQPLQNSPNPSSSSFSTGFDTRTAQRAFTGFGDGKGLDIWTYYPSNVVTTLLNVVESSTADLKLQKTVDRPGAGVGETVTFTIVVSNSGPATATNVSVRDSLPAGLTFVSATPSQGTFNPATGLWTVGTIAANGNATIQIRVTLTNADPIRNRAEVQTSDQPDPNSTPGNNVPSEDDTGSAAVGVPNLRLVKRITAITRSGISTNFTTFVNDPSDLNDTAPGWSQLSPVGILTASGEPLQPGDEVEYTIYYLSDGNRPALSVSLCDQLTAATSPIANTNQVKLAAAAPVAGGTIYSPLAPFPAGNSCSNQSNSNGSVIFDLGNVSATPGNNFGFVRFRVRVN